MSRYIGEFLRSRKLIFDLIKYARTCRVLLVSKLTGDKYFIFNVLKSNFVLLSTNKRNCLFCVICVWENRIKIMWLDG